MIQMLITLNISSILITLILIACIVGFWTEILDIMNRRRWK